MKPLFNYILRLGLNIKTLINSIKRIKSDYMDELLIEISEYSIEIREILQYTNDYSALLRTSIQYIFEHWTDIS